MGVINKTFKIRIYPNSEQTTLINKTLGSCRFLYNQMLNERIKIYEILKDDRKALYEHKYKTEKQYKEEFEFLSEVDAVALVQARMDLSSAYQNFFNSLKGKRRGEKVGYPKFKKKRGISSYRTQNSKLNIHINFETKKIKLPKLGWINFRDGRSGIEGKIKSVTVSRTPTGKYYASINTEINLELKGLNLDDMSIAKTIGLDMSLQKFFVDDKGGSPAYERLYRKYEPKLRKAQIKMSKKVRGSKNWYKALHKVNLIHEIISNKRKDFTHKLSNDIVKNNDIIVVEHLSLKAMSGSLKLGKSVMDLGYSQFVRQLQYKALWSGKLFIQADKFFASSKTCSVCGFKKDLRLSDREWECPNCGQTHDRDQNAGINLKNYGLSLVGLGKPDFKPVEKRVLKDSSMKQEEN